MTLVDSLVRIDHLRAGELALEELLNTGQVLAHPYCRRRTGVRQFEEPQSGFIPIAGSARRSHRHS